jgi:hypothetical protein
MSRKTKKFKEVTVPANLVEVYIVVLRKSRSGVKYYPYVKRLQGTRNTGMNREQMRRHYRWECGATQRALKSASEAKLTEHKKVIQARIARRQGKAHERAVARKALAKKI